MKQKRMMYVLLSALAISMCSVISAQPLNVKFNFSKDAAVQPGYTNIAGNPHLNVLSATSSGVTVSLTGLAASWGSFFSVSGYNGGETTNDGNGFLHPAVVVRNYVFCTNVYFNSTTPNHNGRITGLNSSKYYRLRFFASVDDQNPFGGTATNTNSLFHVGTRTVTLNPIGNTSRDIFIDSIIPNANGEILFGVHPTNPVTTANKWGFLNVLDIIEIGSVVTGNQPPTANAGGNRTITLPTNSVTLNGSGTDSDGTITAYQWTKISGGAATLSGDNTPTLNVTGLTQGTYVFRLTVTDNNNATAFNDATVTVNAANQPPTANAGGNKTITLPTNSVTLNGSGTDSDGTITAYQWTKISGGAATLSGDNTATLNVTGLVQGTYVFRLTVTDNNNATGFNDATVIVNPVPNQPPVANAGGNKTITLPTNSVTLNGSGTDSDGTITAYQWAKISGGAATLSGDNTPTLNVTGLVQGTYVFRLTVTDNNNATGFNDATVTVNTIAALDVKFNFSKDAAAQSGYTNIAGNPHLNASSATASGVTVSLTGLAASWGSFFNVSGFNGGETTNDGNGFLHPAVVVRNYVFCTNVYFNSTTPNHNGRITGLSSSKYYRLRFFASVDDANGFGGNTNNTSSLFHVGSRTVTLSPIANTSRDVFIDSIIPNASGEILFGVHPNNPVTTANKWGFLNALNIIEVGNVIAGNQPPVANAGGNKTIILPTNSVTLNGSGTDSDGTITSYQWTKISGGAATLSGDNTATLNVTGLIQGTYVFRLIVTDNNNATGFNDATVTVNAAGNQPPTANAGGNKTITLPTNSVILNGSGTDSDGTITAYQWTKISGGAATLSGASTPTLNVSGLVQGIYVFRLTVTDNNNATGFNDATVTVNGNSCSPKVIVVLGSSTAVGTGATNLYGWASQFEDYLKVHIPGSSVNNRGVNGQTSYQVMPTGYVPPANRPSPSAGTNITYAVNQNPAAIIINLPSNDISAGYYAYEFLKNIDTIMQIALAANIPTYITTTQPRSFQVDAIRRDTLRMLKDSIIAKYPGRYIDFWTGVANPDGSINAVYNSDNVHVNDDGHKLFFNRVVKRNIIGPLCTSVKQRPVANAGPNQSVTTSSAALSGVESNDPDGTITYSWRKISGNGSSFSNATAVNTNITGMSSGSYNIELAVTDNDGQTALDSVTITTTAISARNSGTPITAADITPQTPGNKNRFQLYPNPAGNEINLVLCDDEKGVVEITVINQAGAVINHIKLMKTGAQLFIKLNTATLKQGIYLLRIQTNQGVRTEKFARF